MGMAREARRLSADAPSGSISRTQAGPGNCFGDFPHGAASLGGVHQASRPRGEIGVSTGNRSTRKEAGRVPVQQKAPGGLAAQAGGQPTAAADNRQTSYSDYRREIIAPQAGHADDPRARPGVESGAGTESSQPDGIRGAKAARAGAAAQGVHAAAGAPACDRAAGS